MCTPITHFLTLWGECSDSLFCTFGDFFPLIARFLWSARYCLDFYLHYSCLKLLNGLYEIPHLHLSWLWFLLCQSHNRVKFFSHYLFNHNMLCEQLVFFFLHPLFVLFALISSFSCYATRSFSKTSSFSCFKASVAYSFSSWVRRSWAFVSSTNICNWVGSYPSYAISTKEGVVGTAQLECIACCISLRSFSILSYNVSFFSSFLYRISSEASSTDAMMRSISSTVRTFFDWGLLA